MESIGYVITNKFILIGVDTNVEMSIGEGDGSLKMKFDNIRKFYKISDTTGISVIGLPHKVSDIYKYILSIKNSDKSFDSVIEDLESIFNSNKEKAIQDLQKVSSVIPLFTESGGAINKERFFDHFKDDPDLQQVAKEAISMMESGIQLGTTIFLFGHENDRNVFGRYLSVANNIIGEKHGNIIKDNLFLILASAYKNADIIASLEEETKKEISPFIVTEWEDNTEDLLILKNKAKEFLIEAVKKLSPFKMNPNIVIYELSDETNNIFTEPEKKLIDLKFDRA